MNHNYIWAATTPLETTNARMDSSELLWSSSIVRPGYERTSDYTNLLVARGILYLACKERFEAVQQEEQLVESSNSRNEGAKDDEALPAPKLRKRPCEDSYRDGDRSICSTEAGLVADQLGERFGIRQPLLPSLLMKKQSVKYYYQQLTSMHNFMRTSLGLVRVKVVRKTFCFRRLVSSS
jgi:hypothetical protein